MKLLLWILAPLLLLGLFVWFGYDTTTSLIDYYSERCGAYPTLDEAIEADLRHNGWDPAWYQEIRKGQNDRRIPYTWYVVTKIKPEFSSKVLAAKPSTYCGGSFYHHTRLGWIGMPENFWNGIGLMDIFMGLFRLYGPST